MIYYIGSYCRTAVEDDLFISPAASTKMEYISNILHDTLGFSLVSLCGYKLHKHKIVFARKIVRDNNETDYLMPSIGSRFRFIRGINSIVVFVYLTVFLLKNVKKTDKVLLYHSLNYIWPIRITKRIKHFKLIIEAEEIYSDVSEDRRKKKDSELTLFSKCDAFLCPSDTLVKIINSNNRPFLLSYGSYECKPKSTEKFSDGLIHCVYAGTFDPNKGGVYSALSAAEFLGEQFAIHIIGFGNNDSIERVKKTISKYQQKTKCKLIYDGLKTGEDYIKYIQKCDIGLSTQNPVGDYNQTSFPSKVFSYLANGLKVVSIRLPVVEKSPLGKEIFYYSSQDGKSIAEAIIRASENEKDSRVLLRELDRTFRKEFVEFISAV